MTVQIEHERLHNHYIIQEVENVVEAVTLIPFEAIKGCTKISKMLEELVKKRKV